MWWLIAVIRAGREKDLRSRSCLSGLSPDEWSGYGPIEAFVLSEEGRHLMLQGTLRKSLPGINDLRDLFGTL